MPPELRRKEKDFVFCVDYTRYKILIPIKPNYWLNGGGQDSNLRRRFMRPCWNLSSLPRIIKIDYLFITSADKTQYRHVELNHDSALDSECLTFRNSITCINLIKDISIYNLNKFYSLYMLY